MNLTMVSLFIHVAAIHHNKGETIVKFMPRLSLEKDSEIRGRNGSVTSLHNAFLLSLSNGKRCMNLEKGMRGRRAHSARFMQLPRSPSPLIPSNLRVLGSSSGGARVVETSFFGRVATSLRPAKDACGVEGDGVPLLVKIKFESSGQGDFARVWCRRIPYRRLKSASPFRECEWD